MSETQYQSAQDASPVPPPPAKTRRKPPPSSFENPNLVKPVETAPVSSPSEDVTVDLTETGGSKSDDGEMEVVIQPTEDEIEAESPLVTAEETASDYEERAVASKKTVKRAKKSKDAEESATSARSINRSFTVPPHLFDLVNTEAAKAQQNTNVFYVTLQERYAAKLASSIEPQSIRRGRPQRRRQIEPMRILNICLYDDENDDLDQLSEETGFNNRSKTVTEILRMFEADLSAAESSPKSSRSSTSQ